MWPTGGFSGRKRTPYAIWKMARKRVAPSVAPLSISGELIARIANKKKYSAIDKKPLDILYRWRHVMHNNEETPKQQKELIYAKN